MVFGICKLCKVCDMSSRKILGEIPIKGRRSYGTTAMLQTQLAKLAGRKITCGATDDRSEINYPKAGNLPPTLFSNTSTPESVEQFEDTFDPKFSTLSYQMKSSFLETGNTETRFFWMIDQMSFSQLFRLYAKFGDANRSGESMSLTCSDKWLRQAKIIDNRRISTSDTGIYFKQVAKFKKTLNIKSYETFLQLLAKKKHLNFDELKYKMVTCGPPETMKTTEVDNRYSTARTTERSRPFRSYRKRQPATRTYSDFFNNCQCQHGYSSQISYSFPNNALLPSEDQDWFPEE